MKLPHIIPRLGARQLAFRLALSASSALIRKRDKSESVAQPFDTRRTFKQDTDDIEPYDAPVNSGAPSVITARDLQAPAFFRVHSTLRPPDILAGARLHFHENQ